MIHTDFEKKFVCGEIIQYDDLVELGSEAACKANGKSECQGWSYRPSDFLTPPPPPPSLPPPVMLKGKDYEMVDGLVCHWKSGA